MAATPQGGCAVGPVTDENGILRPGAHVFFARPTERYPHGVLGDEIEWGALVYILQGTPEEGPTVTDEVVLPKSRVFEDLVPRLVDLDGDGAWEIIVVEADARRGAQLAVYGLRDLELVKLAETPNIGTRFRWLAPIGVGAADLDGDGRMEIAFIDRPHLAKTLRVWAYGEGRMTELAALSGLTNHRIGEDFITGGLRRCGGPPEMILADARWRQVMAVRFDGQGLSARALGAFSQAAVAAALRCE